jgi:hypothetical protein
LARAADDTAEGKDPNKRSSKSGYTYADIAKIEGFKNAVFKILMLRAAEFIEKTGVSDMEDPENRFALTSIEIFLTSADIHNDGKFRPRHETFMATTEIPARVAKGMFDSAEIKKLRKGFTEHNRVYMLACTPQ